MPRKGQLKTFCKRGHLLSETRYWSGGRTRCRTCQISQGIEWRENNKERHAAKRKEICARRTPLERRSEHLRRWWGLTPEEVGAVCHCCGTITSGSLHVDHDHMTGKIRGFLCRTCNTGIGMLKDDPAILRSAAEYLDISIWGQRGYHP